MAFVTLKPLEDAINVQMDSVKNFVQSGTLEKSALLTILNTLNADVSKLKAQLLKCIEPFELVIKIPEQLDSLSPWIKESIRVLGFSKFYKKRIQDILQQGINTWNRALDELSPQFKALLALLELLDPPNIIPDTWQNTAKLFSDLHKDHLTLIAFLIKRQRIDRIYNLFAVTRYISQEEAQTLDDAVKNSTPLLLRQNTERHRIASVFTHELSVKQAGRIPKTQTEQVVRSPRPHGAERELQLLRQVATQLYFSFANSLQAHPSFTQIEPTKRPKLVEVEVMHLAYNGKDHLFIAVNEHSVTPYLNSLFASDDPTKQINLKEALSKEHKTYQAAGSEGKVRTKRYAKKLAQRVFGENIALPPSSDAGDQGRATAVATTLRAARLEVFSYDLKKRTDFETKVRQMLAATESKIYFIDVANCPHKERHAEEFLSDVAEYAKQCQPAVQTSIAGKKRPCMGCTGRMTHTVDHFGKFPGNLWINTIENQPKKIASQTAHVFLSKHAHITKTRDNKRCQDYGTDSESEIEL